MTQPTVTLRLTADNTKLVPAVRESQAAVQGFGKSAEASGQSAQRGAAGVRQLGNESDTTTRKTVAMSNALNQAKVALGAMIGVRGASALAGLADEYSDIVGKLRQATDSEAELSAAKKATYDISQQYYQQLDATVTLYGRSARALKEYGYQQEQVAAMTKTVSAGLLVDRASTAEAAGAMIQLSQALSAGVLRGEEFNSVNEAAPSLMKALADSMGKTRGELRNLANDGKLTIDQLVEAWTGAQAQKLQQQASEVPLTISRAWQQAKNDLLVFVGEQDQGVSASSTVAQGIALLASNLGLLANAALVAAVAYGGRLAAGFVTAAAAQIKAVAASRSAAAAELEAARAAEARALAMVNMARAGVGAAGSIAAAEATHAAAQLRTAAAMQAASIAATAKAAAMRGLNAAMAAFGGPAGLVITALTLFVLWVTNSKKKAEELSKAVTAGFQPAITTLQGFNEQTANTSFANLAGSVETITKAREEVANLASVEEKASQERASREARYGAALQTQIVAQKQAGQALDAGRLRLEQLNKGYDKAISVSADVVLKTAGITNATDAQRQSLEELLKRQSTQSLTLQQTTPLLVDWAKRSGDVAAANRLQAASFNDLVPAAQAAGAAVKAASADIAAGLQNQIATLEDKLVEQQYGKAAAMRGAFLREQAKKGEDPTSAAGQANRAALERAIALTLAIDKGNEAKSASTKADNEATQAAEKAANARKEQAEAQARYTAEAAASVMELNGPMAAAEGKHLQRVAELDAALKKHNITQEAYNLLVGASTAELSRRAAELAVEQQAPQALLDTMSGEVRMLGLVGPARERANRQLRNEQDMRRAINDANNAGADINAEMTESLVNQARAYADLSIAVEEQAARQAELADVGTRGVADFADLLADTFSNSLDESESFFDRMKDVFKNGWRDLLRTMLEQNLVRPVQNMLMDSVNGALNGTRGGSNWMTSLAGLVSKGGLTGTTAMANNGSWVQGALAIGGAAASGLQVADAVGQVAGGGAGVGQYVQIGSGVYKLAGGTSAGLASAAPYAGALGGALYGLKNAGSGGLSTAAATASYGALGWAAGSVVAGALAGASAATAATAGAGIYTGISAAAGGAVSGASAGAAGAFASSTSWVPVVGWTVAGLAALDAVTGGKVFGTKYKAKEVTQTFGVGTDGGYASASVLEEKQKALFGGRKQRRRTVDAGDEARDSADALYKQINDTAKVAADRLGLASVEVIEGSYTRVSDKKGKLKKEFSNVLGVIYNETAEEFSKRITAENVIAQIGQLDDTASAIAQRWRGSAETLEEGAAFLLNAASDFNNGAGLLTTGGLSRLTDLIEILQGADETLTETYTRIMSAAMTYGTTASTAYQEVATAGFSNFSKSLLSVKQEEKERIKALQTQAKAISGLSAREEDLAAVRAAAQVKTDALVSSLQSELVDLALNRIADQIEQLGGAANGASSKMEDFINSLKLSDTLSPDTDRQKRSTASDLMQSAAAAGNADSFTQYAQQFLEVSRNLNASSAGYQADYNQVMDLAKAFGADGSSASLQQLYAQQESLKAQQEAAARLERAQRIAQGVSDLAGVQGGDPLQILRNVTGMTPDALAGDLGLTVSQLSEYLSQQSTDIDDLADILIDMPTKIAQAMVMALADREVPTSGTTGSTGASSGSTTGSTSTGASGGTSSAVTEDLLLQINNGIQKLVKTGKNAELMAL